MNSTMHHLRVRPFPRAGPGRICGEPERRHLVSAVRFIQPPPHPETGARACIHQEILMPHPSGHLHPTPCTTSHDDWAAWDKAWTRHIAVLAGRADLTVVVAPGAGGGAPACFYPSHSRVEVDANYIGKPDVADPRRAAHKKLAPTGYGLLVHEAMWAFT